jgi:hypothetical protein
MPPWHVLAAAALLAISLLHYLSGPTGVPGLEYLKYVSLGAVALCLPRIALRAALALRRGVSAAQTRGCPLGALQLVHCGRASVVRAD